MPQLNSGMNQIVLIDYLYLLVCVCGFSNRCFITDGNEVVIRLLDKNKEWLYSHSDKVTVMKLMWGIKSEIRSLQTSPEVIIGADVILWPNFVIPLLLTVKWMLSLNAS